MIALSRIGADAFGVEVRRVAAFALQLLERAPDENDITENDEQQHGLVELSSRSASLKLRPKNRMRLKE